MRTRGRRAVGLLLLACSIAPMGRASGRKAGPSYELSCGESLTVWRKARDPGARACCALVIRARAGLWTAPERSRELALRAERFYPVSLEAVATRATALLAEGNPELAHHLFERLSTESAEVWAKLPPLDRLPAARAAGLVGKRSRALDHYRSVILELERIPSSHERARVLLEGALVAAHLAPPEVAEAQAYLRQSAGQLAPRLVPVRRLVARVIEPRSGPDPGAGETAFVDDVEQVLWMKKADAPAPFGAPGALLPVVEPAFLRELLGEEAEAAPEP